MKAVHICQRDDPATGGAVRVAFELVKRLLNHQIDTRLLFLYGDRGYFSESLAEHCDYLGLKDSCDIFSYPKLNQYLKQVRPDIVHHHDDLLWPQLLTLNHPNYQKVIHAHGGGTAKPQPLKTQWLYACQRASANLITCITAEAKESQCLNVGFNPKKVEIIYNGIDLVHYIRVSKPEKIKARQNLGISIDAPIIGFVGRLSNTMKGVDDFIHLVAQLPQNWIGLVAGDGPDLESNKKLAKTLEIENRIRFTGLLNDPKLTYQAMDVFCFTSRFEPLGLTILEAMASGIPVIGFSCPGGSHEVLSNDTGIVIQNRDIQQMATAAQSIIANPQNYEQRLINARNLLETKFNWDISVRKLIDLYKALLTN
jgi:glycosyltransferase involved in cell wall biosynthesis